MSSQLQKNKETTISNIFIYTFLIALTVFFIFPFYWIVTGAFKHQLVAVAFPPEWFPRNPTLINFIDLFKQPTARWIANSFIISILTMALVCTTSTLAGYVLAKKRFIGAKTVFWIFIAAMSLPKQVILIPLVQLISSWGFHDTLTACILPVNSDKVTAIGNGAFSDIKHDARFTVKTDAIKTLIINSNSGINADQIDVKP